MFVFPILQVPHLTSGVLPSGHLSWHLSLDWTIQETTHWIPLLSADIFHHFYDPGSWKFSIFCYFARAFQPWFVFAISLVSDIIVSKFLDFLKVGHLLLGMRYPSQQATAFSLFLRPGGFSFLFQWNKKNYITGTW